jgi:hypothetical protein
MAENNMPEKKNSFEKYIIPVGLGLILVLLIACLVVGCNGGFENLFGSSTPSTTAPTQGETTAPPTDPPTEPPTVPQAEVEAQAEKLIAEADLLSAGYDYDKAISLLEGFEHKDRVSAVAAKIAQYQADKAKCSRYTRMDTITHIFFHSLIVDTDRAFGKGSFQKGGYNQWMTTVDEFKFLLESMYERGFVLVTPYQVAQEVIDENGNAKFVEGDIYLPEGKKPFIMSQDDVNYYGYMIADSNAGINSTPVFASTRGDGFAHKIIIGEDGKPTCEYMDTNGNILVGEYDLVPILEAFIQEHPDFAYQGARAVLALTGYEGVFGYRTKPSYEAKMGAEAYAKEVADAKAVTQCLKDNGWIIASHSYGHPNYSNITADRVENDSTKWENTVQPIVGDCDIIIYPHGGDIAGNERYTFDNVKFKALYEDGYRYFFNVNSSDYWVQMGDNYYRGGRRNVDGYRMWYHPYKLDDLMGTKIIKYYEKDENGNSVLVEKKVSEAFDSARPCPVPQV